MSGKFKSTGNIRAKFSNNGSRSQIFFTPNDDSSVRRGDKRYAVFLQESEDCLSEELQRRAQQQRENTVGCLVRKLGGAGEGVPISVNADFPGLVEAAVQQTLVEVTVAVQEDGGEDPSGALATEAQKDDPNLALCAITIPAPGKQK